MFRVDGDICTVTLRRGAKVQFWPVNDGNVEMIVSRYGYDYTDDTARECGLKLVGETIVTDADGLAMALSFVSVDI